MLIRQIVLAEPCIFLRALWRSAKTVGTRQPTKQKHLRTYENACTQHSTPRHLLQTRPNGRSRWVVAICQTKYALTTGPTIELQIIG